MLTCLVNRTLYYVPLGRNLCFGLVWPRVTSGVSHILAALNVDQTEDSCLCPCSEIRAHASMFLWHCHGCLSLLLTRHKIQDHCDSWSDIYPHCGASWQVGCVLRRLLRACNVFMQTKWCALLHVMCRSMLPIQPNTAENAYAFRGEILYTRYLWDSTYLVII